jgi:predicted unusual protein kinase regulating ubiquinone biosynthesis (AarF/ABC1/UbiB family)
VFAPLGRFREVLGNARRENLLHVRYRTRAARSSPDLARRVRLVLEQSGGMFVKFGQIAATLNDLLPDTLTTELSHLHANVARVPSDQLTVSSWGSRSSKRLRNLTPSPSRPRRSVRPIEPDCTTAAR